MHVGPVIAVSDLERARRFYEDQLGLSGEQTPGGWLIKADAGTVCYLLPDVEKAGSVDWPVASFRVENVHEAVRALRSRRVRFLGPDDLPFTLDEDGISSDTPGILVAWMRDPDGSVLTVFSMTA